MTTKQLQRFEVISKLIDGHINATEASNKLSLSVRQIRRLKRRVEKYGAEGLVHKNKGRKSNRAISKEEYDKIVRIIKKDYSDFKPSFANEKLKEKHQIHRSNETIRQIMIKEKLWRPKKRRVMPQHRSWRQRMEREGDMEQFDGSYHDWFETGEIHCLLASIDDATGKLTKLKFDLNESTNAVFAFWREYVEKYKRLPNKLYLDKFSTYKVNHKNATDNSELLTQFERVMDTLGVTLIRANSPQAKGRIERLFKTLQDRLVKEMRLAGIKTMEEANTWLEEVYLDKFNDRFSVVPAKQGDGFVPVPEFVDLDSLFSKQYRRRVGNDFVVRYNNRFFQIEKEQNVSILRKDYVIVEDRLDGSVQIKLERRNAYLRIKELPERPEKVSQKRQIIPANTCKRYVPPKNHPWRKFKI